MYSLELIGFQRGSNYVLALLLTTVIQVLEPFTTRYVFALGIAQFMGSAHWMISVYNTTGKYLYLLGSGYVWLPMVLLTEIVQTFILADFCYFYVKSFYSRLFPGLWMPDVSV
ncbi:uncharacterized protein LOC141720363 isoform X1 [Apium graveolens]|uniref:uncharacterized protein LOC141720363 isoform X1 n=2 Tax=Apium graveolens TaxID=4045 RepID=UPI003D790BF2